MDIFYGMMNALTPSNLLYCFLGCVLGTLVGVLPGLGPSSTLAILLPITIYLDPTGSVIMLAGILYGAMYGGSTTSILVNIPGEAASVATCFDGFQMTRQGRAGEALWIAAVGSFIAGTLGIVMLSVVGPSFAQFALRFGAQEFCGLIFLSLTTLISLSGGSVIKGVGGGLLGIILTTIGSDPLSGIPRFNLGLTVMRRGLELIPVVIGLFGIAEIFISTEAGIGKIYGGKLGKMMPRGKELIQGVKASLRGTLVGLPLGILPGMNAAVTAFMAYDFEKRVSKYPERFGKGVIEGVAAPESANNATVMSGFIPLMAFGIPTSSSMAIILAALMIYGLQPGPVLFATNKQFVWAVIGSMYVGNVMLLILNLPLVGLWARISTIPYKFLGPGILGICLVGAYAPRNTLFDAWVALGAGVLGYIMRKTGWPVATFILGFILGPMFEQSLRQSISVGGFGFFLNRPISSAFFLAAIATITISVIYKFRARKTREKEGC